MAVTERPQYIGSSAPRKEDAKLLTGQARYIDDIVLPGMVWAAVVRSPYAHARITRVDVSKAREAEGVVAAFTGADLADDWKTTLPCVWLPTPDTKQPMHRPLATDKARYAGDGVAIVLAESRALAKDAAELVEVDYEPLPAVVDPGAALEEGAPLVHEELGTNHCYTWPLAGGEDVDEAFANAEVTVKERYRQQRLVPNAIEPRGVVAQYLAAQDEYTLWSSTQIPHILRFWLAVVLGIPETKLRVIAPDVGGGFGSKLNVYAEEALALVLARRVGRPVKWIEERTEGYLSTIHGRDQIQEVELAATAEGKITAVRARITVGFGAYLQLVTAGTPVLGGWLYGGAYDIPAYSLEIRGVFTTTTPTDAYRGAGRPEATYQIERAVDALARKLDMDPVEVRRKNLIADFPHTIAAGLTIDSGDFLGALDRVLELSGYEELRREQADRRTRGGKQLGIGLCTYTEMCGLAPSRILGAILYAAGGWDAATVRCLPTGSVQVLAGTSPHGQGHATTFSQIVADKLGVDLDDVDVITGDTSIMPLGLDTYGSRSLTVGGVALYNATEKIVDKARAIAAHRLEVAEEDLVYEGGTFTVAGTDKALTVQEAALHAFTAHNLPDGMEPGLEATAVYDPPNFSWPGGAHVAVVEVDPETGSIDLVRYVAIDEIGNVINPQIVDGQVHGGLAQGIAQALFEEAVYDEDGNLVTGSMASYMVPSAAELPSFELDRVSAPSPTNPLGVKGVGETGAIASTAAVMNAVVDALAPWGVTDIDMPATPERVWNAMKGGEQ